MRGVEPNPLPWLVVAGAFSVYLPFFNFFVNFVKINMEIAKVKQNKLKNSIGRPEASQNFGQTLRISLNLQDACR